MPEDPVSDTQHADETEAPDPDASAPVQRKRKSRQKGKAAEKKAMLPVHTEYLADPDRYDKLYGAGNWRLFHWDVTETVEYQPEARYLKRVFTPVLSVGLEHTLARPDRVEKLLPHSLVSPSLLADALYRKFVLGVPVCRQVQDLLRHGVVIGKDVISDWIIRFAEDLFLPVCGRLRELLLADPHNHCDETVTQVIRDGRGPSSVCYVWVHTRSELSEDHPVTLFCCEKHARRIICAAFTVIHTGERSPVTDTVPMKPWQANLTDGSRFPAVLITATGTSSTRSGSSPAESQAEKLLKTRWNTKQTD